MTKIKLPQGVKIDKNGQWRNKQGHLVPGTPPCNPKGRPMDKMAKVAKELAQEFSLEALHTVQEIMSNPKEKTTDRIRCAEIILDRSYGKATTVVETEGYDLTPRTIVIGNLEDLEAEDEAILAEGEGLEIEE